MLAKKFHLQIKIVHILINMQLYEVEWLHVEGQNRMNLPIIMTEAKFFIEMGQLE